MRYLHLLPVFMITAGLLILTACSSRPDQGPGPHTGDTVAVVLATSGSTTADGVMASGQIEAVQTAAISTRVMGTITRLYVKVGDKVNKDQLLATINSEDLAARRAQADAQIAGAQAELDNAKKDYDRFSSLFNRQSATSSELDNATLRYSAARSKWDAARQMRKEVDASLAYTRITAPFAGVVTQKLADEGSMANPGIPLLLIEENNILQVTATVAESDINRIKTGDKAEVEIKSTGSKNSGIVTQISASSVATGGQYLIKIGLPWTAQKNLYAGMYVKVFIPVKSSEGSPGPAGEAIEPPANGAILIPATALVQQDQLTGLYTVSSEHTAMLRWIRTGKTVGDKVEVLSGLGPTEEFIVSATGRLYNGVPVKEP